MEEEADDRPGLGLVWEAKQTEKAAICSPCQPTANGIIYPTETSKNAVGVDCQWNYLIMCKQTILDVYPVTFGRIPSLRKVAVGGYIVGTS